MKELHYLPDGRIKVGDHYIIDMAAVRVIKELQRTLENAPIIMTWIKDWTQKNFPTESFLVIQEVLEVGSLKHPPASWRNETTNHHAAKALGHLKDFIYGIHTNPQGEDTLAHALTRLAMAVSVRRSE